ncbi:hypothetical protein BsWGS_06471 [Bradybaena similaris]
MLHLQVGMLHLKCRNASSPAWGCYISSVGMLHLQCGNAISFAWECYISSVGMLHLQCGNATSCPLFHVIIPRFSLPLSSLLTLNCSLEDYHGQADMSNPGKLTTFHN